MGRSVSRPRGALFTVYCQYDGEFPEDWDDFVEGLQSALQDRYPSLSACSQWLDREDRAIVENRHGYIGISEYCGLVCVWAVAKEFHWKEPENREALAGQWFSQIEEGVRKVVARATGGELERVAVASNGEAFYRRV